MSTSDAATLDHEHDGVDRDGRQAAGADAAGFDGDAGDAPALFGLRTDEVTLAGLAGVAWATLALYVVAGPLGAGLGVAVGAVRLLTPGWLTYAAAHVGALAVVPVGTPLADLALVEAGLLLVLFDSFGRIGASVRSFAVALAAFALLAGASVATYLATGLLWAGVVVALCLGAVLSYTAHRYELVSLGLIGGERA